MIQDFIAEVRERGLARTNRYKVEINFPGGDADQQRRAMLMCDSTSLPGLNISTQPHRTFGEAREMPYERTFETINMTFYLDSSMAIKGWFEDWMKLIINPQTRTIGYYDDFVKDIHIWVDTVDEQYTPYVVVLREAYPKSIGAIQLSYESKEVMKLPVTFQYRYWTSASSDVPRITPPPVIRPGVDPNAEMDNSSQGVEGDNAPVTEEEIIAVEDGVPSEYGFAPPEDDQEGGPTPPTITV